MTMRLLLTRYPRSAAWVLGIVYLAAFFTWHAAANTWLREWMPWWPL